MNKDKAIQQVLRSKPVVSPPPGLNRLILERIATGQKRAAIRRERLSYVVAAAGAVAIVAATWIVSQYLFGIQVCDLLIAAWDYLIGFFIGFGITGPAIRVSLFIAGASLFLLFIDYKLRQRYESHRRSQA